MKLRIYLCLIYTICNILVAISSGHVEDSGVGERSYLFYVRWQRHGICFITLVSPIKSTVQNPPSLTLRNLYQWVKSGFSEFHSAVHADDHVRNQWR
jgi:hypothetical protein